jgi:hypothetical protein
MANIDHYTCVSVCLLTDASAQQAVLWNMPADLNQGGGGLVKLVGDNENWSQRDLNGAGWLEFRATPRPAKTHAANWKAAREYKRIINDEMEQWWPVLGFRNAYNPDGRLSILQTCRLYELTSSAVIGQDRAATRGYIGNGLDVVKPRKHSHVQCR